jgi:hypothetical protein
MNMKIYFACPTGQRRDNIIDNYGHQFGACLTRDVFNHVTARKMNWFYDNGAFSDWKKERVFDGNKFINELFKIEAGARFGKMFNESLDFSKLEKGVSSSYKLPMPDFVVVPDLPAKGNESLMFSRAWIDYLERIFPNFEYYLAVQDGMSFDLVEEDMFHERFSGLFVGGTKDWKYKTSAQWVEIAHDAGAKCHIGGIGTRKSILWAKSIGADSVDSGIAMIHPIHLKEVLNIQNELFWNIA